MLIYSALRQLNMLPMSVAWFTYSKYSKGPTFMRNKTN